MATIGISFRIDEDVLKRVDEVAEFCGDSRSDVLTRIIRNGIDEEAEFQKKLRDPMFRKIAGVLMKPAFAMTLAKLAGEELSSESLRQAATVIERAEQKSKKGGG